MTHMVEHVADIFPPSLSSMFEIQWRFFLKLSVIQKKKTWLLSLGVCKIWKKIIYNEITFKLNRKNIG